jgi:hypothetical protein
MSHFPHFPIPSELYHAIFVSMGGNEPRQHHIVPAFYLAGFTDTGGIDGKLHVFDYFRTKQYRSSPRRVCREKDFYRIHEPNEDPNVMERNMAATEHAIAPTLSEVVERGKVFKLQQVGTILSLAALITARDHRGRIRLSTGLAKSLREHLEAGKISREKWDEIRGAELRAGVHSTELPEYDQAREMIRRSEWMPHAPHIFLVGMIPEMQHEILNCLVDRPWELMITDPAINGGFITSDSPLVWGSLDQIQDDYLSASLKDPNLEITFPVNKAQALISYRGARRGNCTATDTVVGHVNMRTLQLSMGLVFHASPNFFLRRRNGQIAQGTDYFAYVEQARRRGVVRP